MIQRHTGGFSLIEVLVGLAIVGILFAVIVSNLPIFIRHAQSSACASHMQGLGVGFLSYATDNDGQLPGRIVGDNDKWPKLLLPYVGDPKSYVDPGDPIAEKVSPADLISNTANNSSFFFNGFNDLGFFNRPTETVHLSNLVDTSNLILLGQKINGCTQYYMDFEEPPHGNQNDALNQTAYFGGSNYLFADGSARFLLKSQYKDDLWLVNKGYQIPSM